MECCITSGAMRLGRELMSDSAASLPGRRMRSMASQVPSPNEFASQMPSSGPSLLCCITKPCSLIMLGYGSACVQKQFARAVVAQDAQG